MAEPTRQYNTAYLLPGREWAVDVNGAQTLTCKYVVFLESPLANAALVVTFSGLPAIGSAHPSFTGLFAQGYRIQEGEGSEKTKIIVSVEYAPVVKSGEGEGSGETLTYIEQMGWRSGSVQRDFTTDAMSGLPVLNTAGQPFDSVPQVDRPSPIWYKVWKTKTRNTSYVTYENKVNSGTLSVGGHSFGAAQVRCVAADEERIFNDPCGYKYRYSIELQVVSNKVKLEGEDTATECGWHLPIVSTGTMELAGGELKRITVQAEDGSDVPVSSPVLLDGNGAFNPTQSAPYVVLWKAYEEVNFPAIFTSENA